MSSSRLPRVFILDDEHLVADTLAQIFNSNGLDAYGLHKPSEVLALAQKSPPDLLVSDVALGPNAINGIELAIQFRNTYPECKILLISGHMSTAELYEKADAGGHRFLLLAKPIHPEELLKACQELLSGERAA